MIIKYFSWVKDIVGKSEETISISPDIDTPEKLIDFLITKNKQYKKAFSKRATIKVAQNKIYISKSTKMMNKLLGALVGFFKGLLFISIFVWFFELIPNHRISKIILSESKITSQLVKIRTNVSKIFYFDKPIKESEKRIEKLIRNLGS